MALYTTELAAEAMREKARAEIERAKRMAGMQRERRRANFQEETSQPAPQRSMDPGVLAALTHRELYAYAKQIGLEGRSKMNKAQLIEAVRHAW